MTAKPERKPGSNLGRAAVDWNQAFLFFAGLPVERRDYQTVANEFKVSVRTVERHGRTDNWTRRARQLDSEAAQQASERLRERRAEKLEETAKVVDASVVGYVTQLRAGKVRFSAADLTRLHDLRTRLWDEADAHAQLEPLAEQQALDPVDPSERRLQVVRALAEAGALDQLLNHPTEPSEDAAATTEEVADV